MPSKRERAQIARTLVSPFPRILASFFRHLPTRVAQITINLHEISYHTELFDLRATRAFSLLP